MPDLFDNFFGKISTTLNGGKTTPHYGGATQVNSGKFYSYHMNGTNNKSWLPVLDLGEIPPQDLKMRSGSVASTNSEEATSRKSSVAE